MTRTAAGGTISRRPRATVGDLGSRIPTLIVSPYAKRGHIDHTFYDTTSVIRFITHRYDLPELPGIKERDASLKKNHSPRLGDLTDALSFAHSDDHGHRH